MQYGGEHGDDELGKIVIRISFHKNEIIVLKIYDRYCKKNVDVVNFHVPAAQKNSKTFSEKLNLGLFHPHIDPSGKSEFISLIRNVRVIYQLHINFGKFSFQCDEKAMALN